MKPLLRPVAYLLAAVPAFFLPIAYFVTVGWLIVYALPAVYEGHEIPEMSGWFSKVAHRGLYAFVIQWPIYAGWILFTRRLTRRLRMLWFGVIIMFSLFAIPWFLVAMFWRTEQVELLRWIRRRSVRHYFAQGIRRTLPRPPRFHLFLPPEYRNVRFRCAEELVPSEFRVITAWNPEGELTDLVTNEAADARLRSEMERLGFEFFPVIGGSPDFSHAEPGYGIICNRAQAVLLARRFRQRAFFEVLGGRVYLVSVQEGHRPGDPVGRWRDLLDPKPSEEPVYMRDSAAKEFFAES